MTECELLRPLLARSAEGELTPAEALRVGRHADDCTACRIRLARERRVAEMVTALGDPIEVDAGFLARVMDELPRIAPRRHRDRRGIKLAGIALFLASAGAAAASWTSPVRGASIAELMPSMAASGGARTMVTLEGITRAAVAAAVTTLDGGTIQWNLPQATATLAAITIPALAVVAALTPVVMWAAARIARTS